MSRSEASSSKSKATATAAEDAKRPVSYETLPPHVTTWPDAVARTGKEGFTSAQDWLRDVGPEMGITSRQQLTKKIADGTIPAVPLSALGSILPVAIGGKAGETLVLPNDPQAARPDPGPLRAVATMKTKDGLISVPTSVMTTLDTNAQDRDQSAKRAVSEAVARVGEKSPASVRLAWVTTIREPKVRVVEYRDQEGKVLVPNTKQDIEALIAKTDLTQMYSVEDLRSDVANKATTSFKQQGTPAARPIQPTIPPALSANGSQPGAKATQPTALGTEGTPANRTSHGIPRDLFATSKPTPAATPTATPTATTVTKAPEVKPTTPTAPPVVASPTLNANLQNAFTGQRPTNSGMNGLGDQLTQFMNESQKVDTSVVPNAETPHALRVFKSIKDVQDALTAGNTHAGVSSGFKPLMLQRTYGSGGELADGSQVIFGVRNGNYLTIVGAAPYAGVGPGTATAGRLLYKSDQFQQVDTSKQQPINLAELGIGAPNQPVPISPGSTSSTFGVPAAARRAIHQHTTQLFGWGGQPQANAPAEG